MSDQAARIAAIRKRVESASAGPWDVDCHQHMASGCRCMSCFDDPTGWYLTTGTTLCCDEVVAQKNNEGNNWSAKNDFGREVASCEDGPFVSFEDADFAAHARQDVPFLLELIGRLEAQLQGGAS
jgi:hypothetical protein